MSTTTPTPQTPPASSSFRNLPRYVSWLGAALALEMLVEVVVIATTEAPRTPTIVPGLWTSAPFVAGLIYGGYRLPQSGIGVEYYGRIAKWCLGGFGVFLAVNVLVMPTLPIVSTLQLAGWIRWASSIGASVGLLIGSMEARAISREVMAERGRLTWERVESRRDVVEHLDTILDSEIRPRTRQIADEVDELAADDETGRLTEIARQARTVEAIVEHLQQLVDPETNVSSLEPINLTALLSEDVASPDAPTGARIDCEVPENEWYVLADHLLPEAFDHLVSYLRELDDSATPEVVLRCKAAPDAVTVRISSDGATVPDEERALLTDYSRATTDEAPELALVALLFEYYEGRVELIETGPEGTVIDVTLRRVTVEVENGTAEPAATAPRSP